MQDSTSNNKGERTSTFYDNYIYFSKRFVDYPQRKKESQTLQKNQRNSTPHLRTIQKVLQEIDQYIFSKPGNTPIKTMIAHDPSLALNEETICTVDYAAAVARFLSEQSSHLVTAKNAVEFSGDYLVYRTVAFDPLSESASSAVSGVYCDLLRLDAEEVDEGKVLFNATITLNATDDRSGATLQGTVNCADPNNISFYFIDNDKQIVFQLTVDGTSDHTRLKGICSTTYPYGKGWTIFPVYCGALPTEYRKSEKTNRTTAELHPVPEIIADIASLLPLDYHVDDTDFQITVERLTSALSLIRRFDGISVAGYDLDALLRDNVRRILADYVSGVIKQRGWLKI